MLNFIQPFALSNLSNSNINRELNLVSIIISPNTANAIFEVSNHMVGAKFTSGPLASKTTFSVTIDNSITHNITTGEIGDGLGTYALLASIFEFGGDLTTDTVLTNYINAKIEAGTFNQ